MKIYECKGTVGYGSNLMDVCVPCEVFSDMNAYNRHDWQFPEVICLPVCI